MKTSANNAMEPKVLTDAYLTTLTPVVCSQLFNALKGSVNDLGIVTSDIANAIGARAYYYGAECKHFCSDVIRLHIIKGTIELAKQK